MIETTAQWLKGDVQTTPTQENNKLPVETIMENIDELIKDTESVKEKYVKLYTIFKDTDVYSIITRIDQNLLQLKKIKYSFV